MKLLRLLAVVLALFIAVSPTAAQWQASNHSVPLGRGAGATGFGSAKPGPAGSALVSNGTTSDPSFQPIISLLNTACSLSPTLCAALFGHVSPEWFGAVGDCVTDDQAPITNAIAAAVSQSKQLLFSRACYAHSGTLAFGFDNLEVRFAGFVTLKVLSGYSGDNVTIDAGAASNQFLHGVNFGRGNPPFLTGHANTFRNLFVRGVVQSWIEARGGDSSTTGNGFEINYAVGTTFRLIYDANGTAVPLVTSKASDAILFAIRNAGETVTACDIFVIVDNMKTGVLFTGVVASTIRGFSENNSATGTYLLNALNNTFIDWFSENNTTHGILIDTGSTDNHFIGGTAGSGDDLVLLSGALRNQFKGGQYIKVIDGGLSNSFEGLGAFTFSPSTTTIWKRVYNGSGVFYPDRPIIPTTYEILTSLLACNSVTQGAEAFILNSTVNAWGTNITAGGGGTNQVRAQCNGVNWTVTGK